MIVLLDRDGVVNVELNGYVTAPNQIELIAGSAAAIARLNRAGIKTALVTNQSADPLTQFQDRFREKQFHEGV